MIFRAAVPSPRGSSEPSRTPRVAMVLNRYHPMIGGAEKQCQILIERIVDRIDVVCVFTHRYAAELAREETIGSVKVRRLGYPIRRAGTAPISYYLSLCWQLLRHRRRYDAIHCIPRVSPGCSLESWDAGLGRPCS